MAKFRVVVVFETDVDDDSFDGDHTVRKTEEWARQTEDDFRDDPENLYNVFDSELGQAHFSVSVVPLD